MRCGMRVTVMAGLACLLAACQTDEANRGVTSSPGAAPGGKRISKVAIMLFKAPTELIGTSVSDMCVTELMQNSRYELVERNQMAQVLNETELALSGLSDAKAIDAGKMMGADAVLVGTVDEYGTQANRGKVSPVVGMSIRMIDCGTGKVLAGVSDARQGPGGVAPAVFGRQVIRELIAKLVQQMNR